MFHRKLPPKEQLVLGMLLLSIMLTTYYGCKACVETAEILAR